MATIKGKLKKCKKGFSVILPTKNGEAEFQIPSIAKCFSESDAMDGLEVDVERDVKNCIVKVTIPGKKVIQGTPLPISGARGKHYAGSNQTAGSNATAADPNCIGEPFTNPYSFIPFPDEAPKRKEPTLRSTEEVDNERFTGVLSLKVKTLSPLMTCEADAYEGNKDSHKKYRALTIGDDVIVPATGIRGSLRTLMTIISGGTLGYMDENLYLCQGRDAQLGPRGKNSPQTVPQNVFLAKIIKPGDTNNDGIVELGMNDCLTAPEKYLQRDSRRPNNGVIQYVKEGNAEIKLSGSPIKQRGHRDGKFIPSGKEITIPAEMWRAYMGRNRFGEFAELKEDWLVWLEPISPNTTEITSAADVKSIQWARWGRQGQWIGDALPKFLLPDSMVKDGKVDMVTDLFGQTPFKPDVKAPTFAGRIRPANLVFKDAKTKVSSITLAPLCTPHPGCVAFYRYNKNADQISQKDPLRGYKVYRTTTERGEKAAPWHYSQQPIFTKTQEQAAQQKINSTRELLNQDVEGELEIALYGLSKVEISLLLHCCSVDWRLGGGKPFGLGHCKTTIVELLDEFGDPQKVDDLKTVLPDEIQKRLDLWKKAQTPVSKLRYPRATKPASDPNQAVTAGHTWFSRHAAPKKGAMGLATLWTEGELKTKAGKEQIRAQMLPLLELSHEDFLYGYDCNADEVVVKNGKTLVSKLDKNIRGSSTREGNSGGNRSQNRDTRRDNRYGR